MKPFLSGDIPDGALQAWGAALDRWRFAGMRADYYGYLSALLDGMQGSRTLKEIFALDAERYGSESVRGRLSMAWMRTYQLAGGDLYSTWMDSLPMNELVVIRTAQSFGNAVLIKTLSELADVSRLMKQAGDILLGTLWSAGMAMMVLLLMLATIPLFTLPRLLYTFEAVPDVYYGRLTRSLVNFSAFIEVHGPFLLVFILGVAFLLVWSLPNAVGPMRRHLDKFAFWRIYRHVQALSFLSLLSVVLGRQENSASTQLRAALAAQRGGMPRWHASHIEAMLARIDAGVIGAGTFDTGLLDRELHWFLTDMVLARGLHEGLALTCGRLRGQVLGAVARQAMVLRWCLLLSCLACLLGIGFWHYAVIDDLRRSLMLFYASQ